MAFSPGTRLGPYEVTARIGIGGMGEVHRAHDSRLGRDVAIKVLPPHLTHDASARERLRREALAAAALDHPFICKIFEIGDHDLGLFVVMEYIVGRTLHETLAAGGMSTTEALRIAGEIAEALEAAHAKRIVHRDLKPANVMLTAQGRVKVMDFGLAKRLREADATPDATGVETRIDVRQDAARRCRAARDVWSDVDTAVWPLVAIYCGRPDEAVRLLEESGRRARWASDGSMVFQIVGSDGRADERAA